MCGTATNTMFRWVLAIVGSRLSTSRVRPCASLDRHIGSRLLVSWIIAVTLANISSAQPSLRPTFVPTLGPSNKTYALAYASNGRLLASGGDDGIAIIWNVEAASEIRRINASKSPLLFVQFCDNDRRLVTGAENGTATIWDVRSGREIASFVGRASTTSHGYAAGAPFATSLDGLRVFTAGEDGMATVWDTSSKQPVVTFKSAIGNISYAAFSPDGAHLLVSGHDGSSLVGIKGTPKEVWGVKDDNGPVLFSSDGRLAITSGNTTGVRLRNWRDGLIDSTIPQKYAWTVSVSKDPSRLLVGTFSEGAALWDLKTRTRLWQSSSIFGNLDSVLGVALASDGLTFGYAPIDRRSGSWDGQISIREVSSLTEIRTLRGNTARLLSVGFVGTTPYILAADPIRRAFLWSQRRVVSKFAGHIGPVISGAVSPSGQLVMLGSLDRSVSIWESSGRQRFHMTGHSQYIASLAFSADSNRAYSAGGPAFSWDTESGQRIGKFGDYDLSGAVLSVKPAQDGTHVFTEAGNLFRLWRSDGTEVNLPAEFKAQSRIGQGFKGVTVSEDAQLLLVDCANADGLKRALEAERLPAACQGQFDGRVLQVQRSAGGERILTARGTIAEVRGGAETRVFDHGLLVSMAALSDDGVWLITASLQDNIARLWRVRDGREVCRLALTITGEWLVFDTDGRFDTSSIEDMRGMSWLLDEAPEEPLSMELFMRDFYTPGLLSTYLTGGIPAAVGTLANRDRQTPRVSFDHIQTDANRTTFTVTGSIKLPSGAAGTEVHDLHVFRNGQLVAKLGSETVPLHVDPKTRAVPFVVSGIQLPSVAGGTGAIDVSAYAFNADRIKGPTTHQQFKPELPLSVRDRTAYIVTFGANVFDEPSWNLKFAANDASAVSRQLSDLFAKSSPFKPVAISLKSERGGGADLPATKGNLRRVLDRLSGHSSGVDGPNPRLSVLKKTTPDDLVVVHIATHGYTDAEGRLFLVPSDSGRATPLVSNPFGARAISGDELGDWLSDIDAGEIVVILDTCQSAAIAGQDFKPAPLGDRGFGQIAYNKRMRVLVGSQADLPALEVDTLQHGLLSYSLAYEALTALKADIDPRDHSLTLREWLQFPVQTLQRLQEQVQSGRVETPSVVGPKRGVKVVPNANNDSRAFAQQPSLLDFAASRLTVISGKPIFESAVAATGADNLDKAEFDAAIALDDPRAVAEALRRFVAARMPGESTAAAWVRLFQALVADGSAEDVELVGAARMVLSHLSLLGRGTRTDALALTICEKLVDVLKQRNRWPSVQAEFRSIAARIRN